MQTLTDDTRTLMDSTQMLMDDTRSFTNSTGCTTDDYGHPHVPIEAVCPRSGDSIRHVQPTGFKR